MKIWKRIFPRMAWLPVLACFSCAKVYCPKEFQDKVNFSEALQFADKADLAYAPDDSVMRACGTDSCFILVGPLTKARAVVMRMDADSIQWIAFQGTQNLSDVLLDANYTEVRDPELGIFLHRGFASGADELLAQALPHLRKSYRTRLTGHSLGGAMAVIAALRLQKRGFRVKVETFGQPKVTNVEGAGKVDSLSLDLLRFVDDKDIVPLMPPVDWKPKQAVGIFAHFGPEIDLNAQGYECLEQHYYKLDPQSLAAEADKQALKDHSLALYRVKIKALADPQAAGIKL